MPNGLSTFLPFAAAIIVYVAAAALWALVSGLSPAQRTKTWSQRFAEAFDRSAWAFLGLMLLIIVVFH